jgi:signal peptidase II
MVNRKNILLTVLLIMVDQGIKFIVFMLYMGKNFILIPNILVFSPTQNIHLNYLGSLLEIKMPLLVMILFDMACIVLVVMLPRYCLFLSDKYNKLPKLSLPLGLAGVLSALIDSVFWGGSIDFILLFDWFTFDIKDVYLNITVALIALYTLLYTPRYYKLSKEDRKKRGIIRWVKGGCPIKSIM